MSSQGLNSIFNRSPSYDHGPTSYRSGSIRNQYYGRDILSTIISRIALDASMCDFKHFKIDKSTGNQQPIDSNFMQLLTVQANVDQTGRAMIYDAIWSMLDEGVVAIVPVLKSVSGDIKALRVGKVDDWYTDKIAVTCLNDKTGNKEQIVVSKDDVAVIESPFYTILNRNNYNLKLLEDKIKVMENLDKKNVNNKIQGAIELSYQLGGSYNKDQSNKRKQELTNDIQDSELGFMFLHPNEKLTKFDGSINDSIVKDVDRLRLNLFQDFGITDDILSGTADQFQVNVYYRRAIDPVLQAITDAFNSKFLTQTARTQGQRFGFYRDIFRLVPPDQLANIADVLGRNGYYAPNEIRAKLGDAPHPDPVADEIFNRNIADANQNGGIASQGQMNPTDDITMGNGQPSEITIYDNGDGTYSDEDGSLVDKDGNLLKG